MTKRSLVFLLLIALALPAAADFRDVERNLRSQLGSPTWIPFLGVARFATWIVRPHGVHDFQLVMWEKEHGGEIAMNGADLETMLRRGLSPEFQPLVRVRSNRSREWTFIYARPRGERFEVLILTHDNSDTVLLRADLDPEELSRTIKEPNRMSRMASR